MNRYLFLLLVFAMGCTSMPGMPGNLSVSESKVDGTKTIYLNPAWVNDSGMKMGLFSSSKNPNQILLTAMVPGLHQVPQEDSLTFNIDGKVQKFSALSNKTDYSTETGQYAQNYSSKTYAFDMAFILRILKAQKVYVKFAFLEGKFSTDAITTARPAFRKFAKGYKSFKNSVRGIANKK